MNTNHLALLELVWAGLWAKANPNDNLFEKVDWVDVYRFAEEQGVVGLVVAGIEWFKNHDATHNVNIPQVLLLQMIGEVQVIESRNKAMNLFIAETVEKMRAAGIYTLLVKGQGVAQCYEKPLWRPSGDVDFLLSSKNYMKAKAFLLPLSSGSKTEERYSQHLGMSIGEWYVEIHGTLRTGLSARVDRMVDDVINNVFCGGNVRSWDNNGIQVFLPAPTEDVFLVFTHFIKHFYKEGMSLRQVCDWCCLLYTYRDSLNYGVLESWIRKAGLMEEWNVFGVMAVEYLGCPKNSMPFLKDNANHDLNLNKKAERLMAFILRGYSGNKVKNTWQIAKIFPWKALRYSPSIFLNLNRLKVKERIQQR